MSKAVDACILLLFVNIGIAAMVTAIETNPNTSQTGLFETGTNMGMKPGEMNPENLSSGADNNILPGAGKIGGLTLGNIFTQSGIPTIIAALGTIIIAAIGLQVATDASLVRIGGISLFAGVFWWVWIQTNGLLSNPIFNLPSWLLNIVTAMYGAVFFIAVVELTTGQRQEGY